jgi:hypothetical protein
MPRPLHKTRLDYPNYIWHGIKTRRFSIASSYFSAPQRSNYSVPGTGENHVAVNSKRIQNTVKHNFQLGSLLKCTFSHIFQLHVSDHSNEVIFRVYFLKGNL